MTEKEFHKLKRKAEHANFILNAIHAYRILLIEFRDTTLANNKIEKAFGLNLILDDDLRKRITADVLKAVQEVFKQRIDRLETAFAALE